MSLSVAILAGGLATRMRPVTEHIPKALLEVAGKPFAIHQLELLRQHAIRRVVFCVGYLGEQIQETLGDGSRWGMELGYVFDGPKLLGTGGALRQAVPALGDAFLVLYGDSYLECDPSQNIFPKRCLRWRTSHLPCTNWSCCANMPSDEWSFA